jgi:hypothetical protein
MYQVHVLAGVDGYGGYSERKRKGDAEVMLQLIIKIFAQKD